MSKGKIQVVNYRFLGRQLIVPGVDPLSQKLIFVDPPYNIGIKYEDDPTTDRVDPDLYAAWCQSVATSLNEHLMPGGSAWWLCPPAHVSFIPRILTEKIGPQRYMVIKTETFAQYQQGTLTEDYRLLFCHQKPGRDITFNPDAIRVKSKRQEMGDKRADPRGRVPGQIWDIRRLQGTSDDRVPWHPCQLAPELLHRIIKGWSNEGDSCMDAFAGSGNFGLASRQLGRDSVLVEGSPTYCIKIKERLGLAP